MSPEPTVSTGFKVASKKLRCTVCGDAFSSWTFVDVCGQAPPEENRIQVIIITTFFMAAPKYYILNYCSVRQKPQRHRDTKAQRRSIQDFFMRASVPLCLCVFVVSNVSHGTCENSHPRFKRFEPRRL